MDERPLLPARTRPQSSSSDGITARAYRPAIQGAQCTAGGGGDGRSCGVGPRLPTAPASTSSEFVYHIGRRGQACPPGVRDGRCDDSAQQQSLVLQEGTSHAGKSRQEALHEQLYKLAAQRAASSEKPREPGTKVPSSFQDKAPIVPQAQSAPASTSRTPEAIRSSRRLRSGHEVLLAQLDAQSDGDGAATVVSQKLHALQQRRKELTRALEFFDRVSSATVPPAAQMLDTIEDRGIEATAEQASDAAIADDDTSRGLQASNSSRFEGLPNELVLNKEGEDLDTSLTAVSLSLSLTSESAKEGQSCSDDITVSADAFDMLVQGLLRVSTSEVNAHVDRGQTEAQSSAGHPLYSADGAYDLKDGTDVAATTGHVESTSSRSTLEGSGGIRDMLIEEEDCLARLLSVDNRLPGLLRPQDLQELKNAQLYAAAALERAHVEGLHEEWLGEAFLPSNLTAGSREKAFEDVQLPPLALALAASLRHTASGASVQSVGVADAGIDTDEGGTAERCSRNSQDEDGQEPWSCLQECLEVVREARGQLTGCKETDDKPPRHIPGPFEGGKEGSKGDDHASALMAKLQCASLSASREGEFDSFDSMNASTLATRSFHDNTQLVNSLDVSFIGTVPGTAVWSLRSSYEMSSVHSIREATNASVEIPHDISDSVVEDDEGEGWENLDMDESVAETEAASSKDRGPWSFLGSSALMTSHIDQADVDAIDDETNSSDDEDCGALPDMAAKMHDLHLQAVPSGSMLVRGSHADWGRPSEDICCMDDKIQELAGSADNEKIEQWRTHLCKAADVFRSALGNDAGLRSAVQEAPVSEIEFSGLAATVHELKLDIGRIANHLLSMQPQDVKCPNSGTLTTDKRAQIFHVESDMRKQVSLVQELSASIASAIDSGSLSYQMQIVQTLCSLLIQVHSQLESFCRQLHPDPLNSHRCEVDPIYLKQADYELPIRAQAALPSPPSSKKDVAEPPLHHKCTDVSDQVYRQQDGIVKDFQCGAVENNQSCAIDRLPTCPSKALLQAALRDVLESSLLEVEAQICEWQDFKEQIHVTDTTAVTLENWQPASATSSLKMGELSSMSIQFDKHVKNVTLSVSRVENEQCHAALRVEAAEGQHIQEAEHVNRIGLAKERYEHFIDRHLQHRVNLAENLRLMNGRAPVVAGARKDSNSYCNTCNSSATSQDEESVLLKKEHAQLSAELEDLYMLVPFFASVANLKQTQNPPVRNRTVDTTPSILPTKVRSDVGHDVHHAEPVQTRDRSTPQRFCSSEDRLAMAKKLAQKSSFCSSVDCIALVQKLAEQTVTPQAPTRQIYHVPRNFTCNDQADACASDAGLAENDILCEDIQGNIDNSEKISDAETLRGRSLLLIQEKIDLDLLAKAEMLQSELQSVALDLAAAAQDFAVSSQCCRADNASKTPVRAVCLLDSASQTHATDLIPGPCATQVNMAHVETIGIGVGLDEGILASHSSQGEALQAECQSEVSDGCFPGMEKPEPEEALEWNGTHECQIGQEVQERNGDAVSAELFEMFQGVVEISKMAMQLSLQLSSSSTTLRESGAKCSKKEFFDDEETFAIGDRSLVGPLAIDQTSMQSERGTEALSSASANYGEDECSSENQYCEGIKLLASTASNAKSHEVCQCNASQVKALVEEIEALTHRVCAIAEMQASVSHSNMLSHEKMDGLFNGVHSRLSNLEKNHGAMDGAVTELNLQVSHVRAQVVRLTHDSVSSEAMPTSLEERTEVCGDLLAPALNDMQGLIKELKLITIEIKRLQKRQVIPDDDDSVRVFKKGRSGQKTHMLSESTENGEIQDEICAHRTGIAHGEVLSENQEPDLSDVQEMQEIVNMLRKRAQARCKMRIETNTTELDLSSFPRGPQVPE